jgi:hypothetical protein
MSKVSMLDEKAHKCEWKETTDECVYVDPVITVVVSNGYLYLLFCLLVASCFVYYESCMHAILPSYFFFC